MVKIVDLLQPSSVSSFSVLCLVVTEPVGVSHIVYPPWDAKSINLAVGSLDNIAGVASLVPLGVGVGVAKLEVSELILSVVLLGDGSG